MRLPVAVISCSKLSHERIRIADHTREPASVRFTGECRIPRLVEYGALFELVTSVSTGSG